MLFSVVIPCYKVEKYIRECLDSVLAQSVSDWEAICVDDGSPDSTGAILDEYAAKDSRVKVIHQTNGGLSAARNAALDMAQGEWIYYLDSDDLMPPSAMKDIFEASRQTLDADLILGKMVRFKDGEICKWYDGTGIIRVVDISNELYARHFGCYFTQFVYHRSTFAHLRFIGESWCEERPYFARCMALAKKVVEIDGVTYGFRERRGSITHTYMNLQQCIGYLNATRISYEICITSQKKMQLLQRMFFLAWTEHQINAIHFNLNSKDSKTAYEYWFSTLNDLVKYGYPSFWFRITVNICRYCHIRFFAWCLFYVPIYLKRKGIHR